MELEEKRARKKEFKEKNLKIVAGNRVQKTLNISQETHKALAKNAYEMDLFESDLAEIAICTFLNISVPKPRNKSSHVENMGQNRRYPNPSGFNNLPELEKQNIEP